MWYEAGRLYNKKNAIKDYIACAKALSEIEIPNIDPNSRSLFVGSKSFSAGGVVVAAAMNESPPGLFQAVSLTNPFLDVMGTMLTSGKSTHFLTEHEWDEFGDPTIDERAHSAISSYCPVLNINKNQSYPPMLIVSAIDDENVPYSNGVQYAFKVRNAMKENCNQGSHSLASVNGKKSNILLHVEKNGGHHLHGRRLDVCTLENCFFLAQLYANTCRR
jgi:oligopeptidase B